MATPRKSTARRPRKTMPTVPPCEPCRGTGEVAVSVRVGRTRRTVGQQNGICLSCFGSGLATE
ncbi:hypothetical protein [Streptomyces lycii]|uniref:Molecular chaperone DnaJ n=1 Tax=Streptomyces lycii TaxID=2654337 RepID=A0ABQ7FB56_9ACTN|nr:hypothetical protein [Streptomyces lycii]KAF4406181.1 hypothetical protein GCU69_26255 [Streptomyces lycii]